MAAKRADTDTLDEHGFLRAMWEAQRTGRRVPCPRDGIGSIVLVVPQEPDTYRLRCNDCSWVSPWIAVVDGEVTTFDEPETPPHPDAEHESAARRSKR